MSRRGYRRAQSVMFVMVSVTVVMRGRSNNREDGGTTSECECIQITNSMKQCGSRGLKIKGEKVFQKKKKK